MHTRHRRSHTVHKFQLSLLELILRSAGQLVLRIRQFTNRLHIILSLLKRRNTAVLLHRPRTRVIASKNYILQLVLGRGVLRQASTQLGQVACLRSNRIVRVQNITAIAEAVVAAASRIISELCNTLSALMGLNAHAPVALSLNLRGHDARPETRHLSTLLKIASQGGGCVGQLRHAAIMIVGGRQTSDTSAQQNRRSDNLPVRESPGQESQGKSPARPRGRNLLVRRNGSVVGGARSVTLGRGARSAMCHPCRLTYPHRRY